MKRQESGWEAVLGFEESNPKLKAKRVSDTGDFPDEDREDYWMWQHWEPWWLHRGHFNRAMEKGGKRSGGYYA